MSNNLLKIILPNIKLGSHFLDLGCGNGRDSLFMAKNGFKVTAVDRSDEVINNLNNIASKINLPINTYCQNILDFNIKEGEYSVINIIDVLHFLKKKWAMKIINDAKVNLKSGGYIILKNFSPNDPEYLNHPEAGYFNKDELKEIFSDFEIIYFNEQSVNDKGHPGNEMPHEHNLIQLVARKK